LRLSDYLQILDTISPFELQESWDNSGLQVGDPHQEIKQVFVAIDLDRELIASLPEGALLITHHPLIFSPLRVVDFSTYPGNLIGELIRKSIALVALHTNFDKSHLNSYVAREILGMEEIECRDFICYFDLSISFERALNWVQESFQLPSLRYVEPQREIERVALTTGSGGGLIDLVEADLFLTGDLKYHDAMKASNLGLGIIDIGHFESEIHFGKALAEQLKKYKIEAIIAPVKNPLHYKGN